MTQPKPKKPKSDDLARLQRTYDAEARAKKQLVKWNQKFAQAPAKSQAKSAAAAKVQLAEAQIALVRAKRKVIETKHW